MTDHVEMVEPLYRGNIWCTPQERMDWRLYLTELGDEPKNHIEAVDMIREAGEEDVVEVLITSPGGYCNIADMYLSAIADSKAKIITRAIGECASAATTIFLAGHERICDDGAYFMFHNVQFGVGGDSATVFTRSKFYERLFKEKHYSQMAEVLTPGELSELFERAGEVYLTAEEMRDRLKVSEDNPAGCGSDAAEVEISPEDWWKMMQVNSRQVMEDPQNCEILDRYHPVSLPFPKSEVKSATEFPQGDEFDVTLDEGYKKTFRLSTLDPRDFDEYNIKEINEIGADGFGIDLSGMTRKEALLALIDEIQNGGGEE